MRRISGFGLKVGLAAAVVLLGAGCDDVPTRVAEHHARGVERLARNDPAGATLDFRNALRLDPNHAPSRFEIARLYEADGEFRAAFANYRLTAELDAAHLGARVRLAELLLAAGQAEDARPFVDQAMALAPGDAAVLSLRAGMLELVGDTPGARAAAEAALAADPDAVAATAVLLTQRHRAGDTRGALAALDAELARRPTERTLNLLKLALLDASGDAAELDAHLEHLVALFPEERRFAHSLVEARLSRGDVAGAERAARGVADRDPENADAALEVVRLVALTGGVAAAEAELRRLVEAGVGPIATYEMAWAELEVEAGRPDDALRRLTRVAESWADPASVADARHRLASLAIGRGDLEAARRELTAALAQDDSHVGALALRAGLNLAQDLPEDALADLRRAAREAPRDPDLLTLEAVAQERLGNQQVAIERLAAAATAANLAPAQTLAYAAALSRRGQIEGMEAVLAESAARHPTDASLLLALAEARIRLGREGDAAAAISALAGLPDGAVFAEFAGAVSDLAFGRAESGLARLTGLTAHPLIGDRALEAVAGAHLQLGAPERAVEALDAALAADPLNTAALALKAQLLAATGDPAAGEEYARRMIDADPRDAGGHLLLARFQAQRGDFDAAEASVRAGVAVASDTQELRLALASLHERRGDFDAAIAEYERLHAEGRGASLVVANNLASLLAQHRADDPETRARALRIAARLRSETAPEFRGTLGWVLFLNGQLPQALPHLEAAAAGLPREPLVHYHLGRVYAATGQVEKARERLALALAIGVEFPQAQSARDALAALPPAPAIQ